MKFPRFQHFLDPEGRTYAKAFIPGVAVSPILADMTLEVAIQPGGTLNVHLPQSSGVTDLQGAALLSAQVTVVESCGQFNSQPDGLGPTLELVPA